MSLIVPRPEPNRIYTHLVARKYIYSNKQGREKQYKRIYIHSLDELKQYNATESDLIYSYYEFSLHPLLTQRFWADLSLHDRLKLVYPATARNLWLLAIMEGVEVTTAAVKSCNSGTELVEVTGRTVIEQKLQDLYTKRWFTTITTTTQQHPPPTPLVDRCLIVGDNDDRIPSLPIYELSNDQLISFMTTCFGPCLYAQNDALLPTWNQIMKSRHFQGIWRWKDQVDIVPYAFLRRVVYEDTTNDSLSVPPIITLPLILSVPSTKKRQSLLLPQHHKKRNKKTMMLLQVVALETKLMYQAHWGTPVSLATSPFTFYIGDDKEEYCDTFESFYVSHPHISTLLNNNAYINDQFLSLLQQEQPKEIVQEEEPVILPNKNKRKKNSVTNQQATTTTTETRIVTRSSTRRG